MTRAFSWLHIKKYGGIIGCVLCMIAGILFICNGYAEKTIPVQIETPNKTVRIHVEKALTPAEQALGLMYRHELPENNGMIFIFPKKRMVNMWMKNTYIPLDMIFFDEKGLITHIHLNAHPLDLTIISSVKPAIGVIEVNAGFVEKHQIQTGQHISYPNHQSNKDLK